MKLNTYKNYRTCPICGKNLPFSRKFFKRVNKRGQESLHLVCRECEDKMALEEEWKDGKLLCHYCGEYKPVECFSPNGGESSIRNNRRSICNECNSKRQRVCMACNQIKSDITEEEMYNFCKKIVKTYENKNNKNT